MKTIVEFGGSMYHKGCLDELDARDARVIPTEEVDEEMVCEECAGALIGDNAPEDPEPTVEDEEAAGDKQAP